MSAGPLIIQRPILEVHNLFKHFPVRGTLLDALLRKPAGWIKAVDGISFSLERGEVLALVGESGCGKTTIARTLIGLEEPTSGQILFDGKEVEAYQRRLRTSLVQLESSGPGSREHLVFPKVTMRRLRQHAQMIFQDPYESLNPRATIYEIVAEPLVVHGLWRNREERMQHVRQALEDAGLRPAEDFLQRFPHELSGGQRQRVVIASAMVLQPQVILADEPVSMLDVSIRAEILNLLREMQRQRQISILFITHDLGTVAYFADRIAVMYLGRIVEIGPTQLVLRNPQHPYTRALLSVVPVPNPRLRRQRMILQGETPNPIHIPSGCRFHPRCPVAIPRCTHEQVELVRIEETHQAACLLVEAGGTR